MRYFSNMRGIDILNIVNVFLNKKQHIAIIYIKEKNNTLILFILVSSSSLRFIGR